MLAVIKTGGKQYLVQPGDKIKIEKLASKEGAKVVFDKILLVIDDKKNVSVGAPLVKGAKAEAKVLEHGKGKKVIIYKYKAKKRTTRKKGHRQPYTKVEILKLT